jgi:hypothetical protein
MAWTAGRTLASLLNVTRAILSSEIGISQIKRCLPSWSPSCIVVTIVLSECFTTSSTLRPLLSAGKPVAGSAGIDALELIEPETSMTQQMSNGARRPTELLPNVGGGVTVMRTALLSGSEDRETESVSSVTDAAVCDDAIELGVVDRICMAVKTKCHG